MKIYLSTGSKDKEGFIKISSYEELSKLTEEELGSLEEIKIDDFLLGLNAIFYLRDNYRDVLRRVHFSIDLTDYQSICDLTCFIKKHKWCIKKEDEARRSGRYKFVTPRKPSTYKFKPNVDLYRSCHYNFGDDNE